MEHSKNFLDSIIEFVSPSLGMKRADIRQRMYEGADKGRRNQGWKRNSTSSDAEVQSANNTLRDGARDLDRNSAHAHRAINVISNNVIGAGIRLSIKGTNKKLATSLWNDFANTTDCDFDNQLNFYGIEKLVMRTVALSGACLVIKKKIKFEEGKIPIQFQILESDYIDNGVSGENIYNGIEFSKSGKRIAYHIYNRHPGGSETGALESTRVLAKDVLHIYRKERPGQNHGVTFLAPVMTLIKSLKDYEDAELEKQKVAASFAAFVEKDNPEGLNGSSENYMIDKIEPGMIQYLKPGERMTFASPPTSEGYDQHTKSVKHSIASGAGVTYEAMTGDFSMVNFSSGRMGWIESQKEITDLQLNMMIPMFCSPAFKWFLEATKIAGLLKGEFKDEWTAPKRELLDVKKEIEGMKASIRAGLTSWQEAARELGWDPDSLISEIKEDNNILDSNKIILDSDPRQDPERITAMKTENKPIANG